MFFLIVGLLTKKKGGCWLCCWHPLLSFCCSRDGHYLGQCCEGFASSTQSPVVDDLIPASASAASPLRSLTGVTVDSFAGGFGSAANYWLSPGNDRKEGGELKTQRARLEETLAEFSKGFVGGGANSSGAKAPDIPISSTGNTQN